MLNKDEQQKDTDQVGPSIKEPALRSVDHQKLDAWRQYLEEKSIHQNTLYLVSDTETSGTMIYEEDKKEFNRVLEWALIVCEKNEQGLMIPIVTPSGDHIIINEPINPFIEPIKNKKQQASIKTISEESTGIHGLTMEYLFGLPDAGKVAVDKKGMTRPAADKPAAYFEMVIFALQRLFNFTAYLNGDLTVHLVFHNAPFDIGFLNHEMEMAEHSPIESFFIPLDTLKLAKLIIPKKYITEGYSLDSLFKFGLSRYPDVIKEQDRPFHGALIDSFILIEVWNTIHLFLAEQQDSTTATSDEDTGELYINTDDPLSVDDVDEAELSLSF